MAPRSGLEAMSNTSSGSLSPVVAQGGLIQPPPARGSSTPNFSHSPISRSRPNAAAPPQRDFSDSSLVQLAPPQNPNPLYPQSQQSFQNSGSFAANFSNPGPTPQPLNVQGFPPQSSPAPGSFATNWQQPNQPSGGGPLSYPQANGPQMMGGPTGPQSQMIPNQFAQGNSQMMVGPQSQMMPAQYQMMLHNLPEYRKHNLRFCQVSNSNPNAEPARRFLSAGTPSEATDVCKSRRNA